MADDIKPHIELKERSSMPAKLSVNLNAIAMLRNRRDLPWPSVTGLGRAALAAGAAGLTVHPRPDQRHIRFTDLGDIRALIDDEYPQAEFNIEGFPTEAFLELVEKHQPEQVTLVPDDPMQATSDHGWDFETKSDFLEPIVQRLKSKLGYEKAKAIGADRIELYTGPYGATYDDPAAATQELSRLGKAADAATALGLAINAGHDLTVENLPALVKRVPQLSEVSIGHGLTADALTYGMPVTISRYIAALAG
jgi:pyridoxine 5-phosphate synthase